ncbi:MAG: ketol-acid reductoisomerase [Dehalococcoidia bacterium]
MASIYYERDADVSLIKEKTVGIVGFGSQGHAHAQNLRDSGCNVIVAAHPGGKSWKDSEAAGFRVVTADEVAKEAGVIMMLVPDTLQPRIYHNFIEKNLTSGKMLMFAHGFNIHFNQIVPPADVDVTMIAPKGPGHMVRQLYEEKTGIPALIAVHQDASGKAKDLALAYASGLGSAMAGVLETTFQEETETDLFGEQTVLCGGVSSLIKTAFETLVDAGYQPEIAYFEVCHELKLIVDLIHRGGLKFMRYSVSDTAEYGDYTRGPRVINESVREEMWKVLEEIQNGTFAREWILENQANCPAFNAYRKNESEHELEEVGAELRSMMPWLK